MNSFNLSSALLHSTRGASLGRLLDMYNANGKFTRVGPLCQFRVVGFIFTKFRRHHVEESLVI